MFWIYAVFTMMMFILEFLVINLKLCWKKSELENESEAIEQLHKERTKRYLHSDSPLGDPVHVPASALVGWSGRLFPATTNDETVMLSGEGTVFVS